MGIIIKQIEYYLPERIVTNDDLALSNPDWDMEKTALKSGIFSRHIAGDSETALDLAVKAVEKLLCTGAIKQEDIQAIVFCTQSPDYIMPSNSFLIHKHFKFSQDVFTFDYNLACSGYIFGLAICQGLIKTNLAKNVLLITADTYSKHLDPTDRSTTVLFGDGAAASIISETDGVGVIDIILSSNGEKFDTFYIPAGGCRVPHSSDSSLHPGDRQASSKNLGCIHMKGFEVWQFISKHVSEQISKLLAKNNLTVAEIDQFIFHQASKLTLDSLVKILKIKSTQTFTNLLRIGNTVSSSIPIALKDAEDGGRVRRGDLIILSGFGVGLSWGSIIMRY